MNRNAIVVLVLAAILGGGIWLATAVNSHHSSGLLKSARPPVAVTGCRENPLTGFVTASGTLQNTDRKVHSYTVFVRLMAQNDPRQFADSFTSILNVEPDHIGEWEATFLRDTSQYLVRCELSDVRVIA